MSPAPTGFPSLEPTFILKLDVGQMNPIGDVSSGSSLVHIVTPTGTLQSLPGFEPKIDAKVEFGADWLYFTPEKDKGRFNVKGIAKTAEGTAIAYSYTGVAHINDEINAVMTGSPDARTLPFGRMTSTLTFEVGDPKYKDLELSSWVGNGRFVVGKDGVVVETRISKVIPSHDMD